MRVGHSCCVVSPGVDVSNLCEHGGVCRDVGNSHRCDCALGYDGSYCGTQIDECASAPCRNGATCVDHIGRYTCICLNGFQVSGVNREI